MHRRRAKEILALEVKKCIFLGAGHWNLSISRMHAHCQESTLWRPNYQDISGASGFLPSAWARLYDVSPAVHKYAKLKRITNTSQVYRASPPERLGTRARSECVASIHKYAKLNRITRASQMHRASPQSEKMRGFWRVLFWSPVLKLCIFEVF